MDDSTGMWFQQLLQGAETPPLVQEISKKDVGQVRISRPKGSRPDAASPAIAWACGSCFVPAA
jgi:hypothetical protein